MLVIQHRSKFCRSEAEYRAEEHVPFTFMVENDMDQKITELRPFFLHWFLQGTRRYMQHRFTQLPKQVEDWKTQLVQGYDTVGTFISEKLIQTHDKDDHVQRAVLYDAYRDAYPEENNRKTSMGKRKWFYQMQKHMGSNEESGFYTQKKVIIDGCGPKVPRKDVWIKWRMVTE